MDVVRELISAQKAFNEKLQTYHKEALLPLTSEAAQVDAVKYYTLLIDNMLTFVGHLEQYYSTRPEVKKTIELELDKVSDHIAKIAGGREWDVELHSPHNPAE